MNCVCRCRESQSTTGETHPCTGATLKIPQAAVVLIDVLIDTVRRESGLKGVSETEGLVENMRSIQEIQVCVQALLQAGAFSFSSDKQGNTPLPEAIRKSRYPVRFLLEHGLPINRDGLLGKAQCTWQKAKLMVCPLRYRSISGLRRSEGIDGHLLSGCVRFYR